MTQQGPAERRTRTEQPMNTGGSSGSSSNGREHVRVAAGGDVHCREGSRGLLRPLFEQMVQAADVIVLCGDLTDHGLPAEAKVLLGELAGAGSMPTVAVLGNHDYEADQPHEIRRILCEGGLTMLDGEAVEVQGIGFAGVKGFAGGFGRGTLSSFGEPAMKLFVKEAIDEAMKLEAALLRLRTPHKIAVLHYAPIHGTVEGEPIEIFP